MGSHPNHFRNWYFIFRVLKSSSQVEFSYLLLVFHFIIAIACASPACSESHMWTEEHQGELNVRYDLRNYEGCLSSLSRGIVAFVSSLYYLKPQGFIGLCCRGCVKDHFKLDSWWGASLFQGDDCTGLFAKWEFLGRVDAWLQRGLAGRKILRQIVNRTL